MAETRRKFDADFKEGAVRLVRETGRPIAQVAKDLGINEGTLGNWVNADKRRRGEADGALSEDERAELARLRKENAELAMERVLPHPRRQLGNLRLKVGYQRPQLGSLRIPLGQQLPKPGVRRTQPGNRLGQDSRLTGHKGCIGHKPHPTTAGPP